MGHTTIIFSKGELKSFTRTGNTWTLELFDSKLADRIGNRLEIYSDDIESWNLDLIIIKKGTTTDFIIEHRLQATRNKHNY